MQDIRELKLIGTKIEPVVESTYKIGCKQELAKPNLKRKIHKCSKNTIQIIDSTKIFAIHETRNMIEPLRKALINRNWVEKSIDQPLQIPTFVWLGRSNGVPIEGCPIVNRVRQNPLKNFCYKDVLLSYARDIEHNPKADQQILNVPRTYMLFKNEKNEFLEDYSITAFSSFIRFILSHSSKVFSDAGKIHLKWIDYAIENLETAIVCQKRKSYKKLKANKDYVLPKDFSNFKQIFQSVVKYHSRIKPESPRSTKKYLRKCKVICKKSKEVWPHFDNDGFYNLWLLKPSRRSLGIGIKIFDDDINIFSYEKDNEDMKYLVQKYIERPMLIYKTKFDLRQYFILAHHESRICLWMYRMCYLKFSSKLYDPLSYKVSVHITNTAIQSKYMIDKERSTNIPLNNEWSGDRFLQYLKNNNQADLWDTKIYPLMKKNIIITVSASLDLSMLQPNRFQLYGCDFVIDGNYEPILLEINGCPILTSIIDSNCLGDVVRVIVDTRELPSAHTGHFEMIWEKDCSLLAANEAKASKPSKKCK